MATSFPVRSNCHRHNLGAKNHPLHWVVVGVGHICDTNCIRNTLGGVWMVLKNDRIKDTHHRRWTRDAQQIICWRIHQTLRHVPLFFCSVAYLRTNVGGASTLAAPAELCDDDDLVRLALVLTLVAMALLIDLSTYELHTTCDTVWAMYMPMTSHV